MPIFKKNFLFYKNVFIVQKLPFYVSFYSLTHINIHYTFQFNLGSLFKHINNEYSY